VGIWYTTATFKLTIWVRGFPVDNFVNECVEVLSSLTSGINRRFDLLKLPLSVTAITEAFLEVSYTPIAPMPSLNSVKYSVRRPNFADGEIESV
jgi:hypothetical protein